MHPILFRVPLNWLLYGVAGLALLYALYTLIVRRDKLEVAIAAGIGLCAIGGRFAYRALAPKYNLSPDLVIPIYSYGVMLGLSLVVGWYLTLGLAERDGLPKEVMANCYVVTAVAAVVGSRVLYIVTNLNEFDSFGSLFAMRRGGLVAYGGFLGGFLGSFFYLRRHKIPLLPWADVAVPSLASGLMITRIGCYLFGCDFGQPLKATAPAFLKKLGTFPHWAEGTLDNGAQGSPAWMQHINRHLIDRGASASLPVHPTQLYESLVGAFLLVLLLVARKQQKFRGQIFLLFTFSYGVCRYLLEVLRDDAERGSIPPSLPEHILVPLGMAVLSLGYCIGFSQLIKNMTVRRITQVLSFAPVVGLYFVLKPDVFETNMEFSTSQFIAISTGFAASVAFSAFYKSALAHPEAAMALHLPRASEAKSDDDEDDEDDDEDDEDDDDEESSKGKPIAKKTAAMKTKTVPAKKAPAKEANEDDEEAPKAVPVAKKTAKKAEVSKAEGDEEEDEGGGDDEPESGGERPAKIGRG